jgi:hypothetical protein
MPDPGMVQPTTIEWVKTISKYLAVPMFAIFLKFFIQIIKMVVLQSGRSAEKSAEDAEKERRLLHCETSITSINSDIDGLGRRVDTHDKRIDHTNERVDKVYAIVAEK